MKVLMLTGLLACLAGARADAEDVGAVMAALKDDAAECHYYALLCERMMATIGHGDPDAGLRKGDDLWVARDVLESKHGKIPACAKPCGPENYPPTAPKEAVKRRH